jgi:double-strand break repair protein MRE11
LHFILWGHEHECLIQPQINEERGFAVCQAGSSVATSLSEGESKPKHIALLEIEGTDYRFTPIPLKRVRPFFLKDVSLKDAKLLPGSDQKALNNFLIKQVEQILEEYQSQIEEMQALCPPLSKPLIRLRVDYTGGYPTLNPQRFGQAFIDRVANAKDIVLFYRKKIHSTLTSLKAKNLVDQMTSFKDGPNEEIVVDDLINNFLEAQHLSLLPENEFGEAVRIFVDKDEKDAIIR